MATESVPGTIAPHEETPLVCRDSWIHNLPYDLFSEFSCVKCFVQVFFNSKELTMNLTNPFRLYHRDNRSLAYEPDASSEPSQVCDDWLTTEECSRWRQCCGNARKCCSNTQQEALTSRDGRNGSSICSNNGSPYKVHGIIILSKTVGVSLNTHLTSYYYLTLKFDLNINLNISLAYILHHTTNYHIIK